MVLSLLVLLDTFKIDFTLFAMRGLSIVYIVVVLEITLILKKVCNLPTHHVDSKLLSS